jgi:hypothetical protein
MAFLNNGGLEKAIHWYPLDPTVKAIQVLYEQRETIKQTIYEVTGIADILRGATDATETATAQQLKAQWGSLRIQRRQAEVARFARDLFELKAEIIASKFDWPLLSKMTGIDLPSQEQKQAVQALMQQVQQAQQMGQQIPPQIMAQGEQAQKMLAQPSIEEVMGLLQDDISRQYRIDIESDSTIRNDLSRNQQTMNMFLQGTAQFGAAMGPIIMADASMKPVVMEIYGAFARQFKLGRQAEDAIEAATEMAQQSANQPPPSDPQVEIEREKMAMEKERMGAELQQKQAEMQLKQQEAEAKLQLEVRKAEMEIELKKMELAIKQHEAQAKMEMEAAKAQQDAELKAATAQNDAAIQRQKIEQEGQLKAQQAERDAEIRRTEAIEKLRIEAEKAAADAAIKEQGMRADTERKAKADEDDQKRKKADFEAEQRRKDIKLKSELDAAEKKRKADAEREEEERRVERAAKAAERAVKAKQPKKPMKVKLIEDKNGNFTAEIED